MVCLKKITGYTGYLINKKGMVYSLKTHKLKEVDHIDNNRSNSNASNLRYVSPSSNICSMWARGDRKKVE